MKTIPHQTKEQMRGTLGAVAGPGPIKSPSKQKYDKVTVGQNTGSKQTNGCGGKK